MPVHMSFNVTSKIREKLRRFFWPSQSIWTLRKINRLHKMFDPIEAEKPSKATKSALGSHSWFWNEANFVLTKHTIEQIWHYYITAGPKQFKFCAGVISNYISDLHAYLSNNNRITLICRNVGELIQPINEGIHKNIKTNVLKDLALCEPESLVFFSFQSRWSVYY